MPLHGADATRPALPCCLQASQHARCRVRVTVRAEPGVVAQEGHKVMLAAVMVSHRLN